MSNLNTSYLLRQDRLRRLREAYDRGSISQREYRIMLAQEGFVSQLDTFFVSIGDAATRVVGKLK